MAVTQMLAAQTDSDDLVISHPLRAERESFFECPAVASQAAGNWHGAADNAADAVHQRAAIDLNTRPKNQYCFEVDRSKLLPDTFAGGVGIPHAMQLRGCCA